MTNISRSFLSVAMLLGFSAENWAQAVPDAGSIRQQIEPSRSANLPQAAPRPQVALPPERSSANGISVKVQTFRFLGNNLLSSDQLHQALIEFAGRELGFDGLQRAANAVAAAYRKAGWIVRVYLPEQDVSGGVITFQVVEARFAGVRIEGTPAKRVNQADIEAWFRNSQPIGQPLNATALDRALLLADDLPGLSVAGTLVPGLSDGETALALQTTDEPFVYGDVGVDNHGLRSTGSNRLIANVNINSPGGRGELVSMNLLHTKGSDYGRIALTVPDGYNGLRLGVSASAMNYKIIEGPDNFLSLGITGRSSSLGIDWSYPLVRERQKNLFFLGGLDNKSFVSSNNQSRPNENQTFSDYETNSLRLGLSGNRFDNFGGGGANNASFQALWGQLTQMQGHSQINTIDRSYSKINYNLSRQQNISAKHSLLVSLQGQHTDQVLDSSERFFIGGAQTVRAYPASEMGGDRGQVLSSEWRWRLHPTLVLTAFADIGRVNALPLNVNDPQSALQISGHGLSLGWQAPLGITTKVTWSNRNGRNPRPTQAQTDGDGTLQLNRFWFTVNMPF